MNRIFQVLAAVFILVLALAVSPALSRPCKAGPGNQGATMTANGLPQLNAEEQKIVTELNDKYRPLLVEQRNQLTAKRTELQTLMMQETFEADKAKSLNQEIAALHSKLMELRMAQKIEMREKGIAYSVVCAGKDRRPGPCPLVGGKTGANCKGPIISQGPQGAAGRPCAQ